ncbi:MAG TPA: hypothetical protein IAB23_04310 [Candidatus Scybalocola faecavium]|nr:hypothetical protein [Candidatus Scybalocola faecavium]
MKLTPDGAQKLIHSLEEERKQLVDQINKLALFVVAVSEGNPEELRPEFDFTATVDGIRSIDEKIRKIKHARNVFNTTTVLPEEKMTVDEALVLMATLNNNYGYFADLGNRQPKTRNRTQYKGEIEYTYTNYNIGEAKKLAKDMYERILEIQSKLNLVNSTYNFEIDL